MNNIQKHNQDRVSHIYNSFTESSKKPLEKALTVDEFNSKYGAGYEVFTERNLSSFKKSLTDTAIEKGETQEAISKDFDLQTTGLEKIFVQDEKGAVNKFFVRKK